MGTLPLELKSVLDSVVKAVNFIRGRAMNSDCSKHCATTLERSISIFFFTPKCDGYRKVLSSVAELVTEVAVFLRKHGSVELAYII